MNEQEIERRLREAFAARARAAVSDTEPAPPPRFASAAGSRRRRAPRLWAPIATAAAVLAVVGGVVALTRDSAPAPRDHVVAGGSSTSAATSMGVPGVAAPVPRAEQSAPRPSVHVRLYNGDGATYGVGMPVIAIFSSRVTDARPFAAATTVTVNGKSARAAWYFTASPAGLGAMEAHLRPRGYWPAHANVHVKIATEGLSAGRGVVYDDSVTVDFRTGPRTIATVDYRSHMMTVSSDGREIGRYPVSLGAARTPTMSGVKVIMDQRKDLVMRGPGYKARVHDAQQLTYTGEYLLAAPWRMSGIKQRVDESDGCTELLPNDAAVLFKTLRVGDVVDYPNAPGPAMSATSGFGDWNVPWSQWLSGGLLPTS